MTGPVDTYLERLETTLSYPPHVVRSVTAEVRDHLLLAAADYKSRGSDEREAQQRAVDEFGSAEELMERFTNEGGPTMSKISWKSPVTAALFALPGVVFALANLLAFHIFGNRVVYDAIIRAWDNPTTAVPANIIVLGGPLAALGLTMNSLLTLARTEDGESRVAVIRLDYVRLTIAVIATTTAVALFS